MKPTRRTVGRALAGVGVLVALAPAVLATPNATAAQLGSLTVLPAKGNSGSIVTVVTSAACPSPATNVIATMYGKGFPTAGQNVIGNSPIKSYPKTQDGKVAIALQYTFADTAKLFPEPVRLSGTYRIVVTCRGAIRPKDVGRFTGSVTFGKGVDELGYRPYTASNPSPAVLTKAQQDALSGVPGPTGGAVPTTNPSSSAPAPAGTSIPTVTGAAPGPGSSTGATAPTAAAAAGDQAPSSGSSNLPAVLLVGLGALVAVGAVAYLLRSRRATS